MLDAYLPVTTDCHACGYDLTGRPAGDPCPECGTPFDARPNAPGSRTRSATVLVCLTVALIAQPFVALLSLILWWIAWANQRGLRQSLTRYRLSHQVARRMRFARYLWWANLAAFWALMLIHTIWPDALNWW